MISLVLLNGQKYPKAGEPGTLKLIGVSNLILSKTPLALKKLADGGSLKICGDLLSYRFKVG